MYEMNSCLILWLMCFMCEAITVERQYRDIVAKSKIELTPVLITCKVNDIAVVTAPIVHCKDPIYHLYKPNGDFIKLQFNKSYPTKKYPKKNSDSFLKNVMIKYFINQNLQTEYPLRNSKILDYRSHFSGHGNISIDDEEKSLKSTDFFMGPLMMEDHGNWLLSVFCKDIDDNWIEMFQTITVEIIEHVPLKISRQKDGVKISFEYPICNLESCEIIAPRSTHDRYYDRSKSELDRCGYIITNITNKDEGFWTVIGVGSIVYRGTIKLYVRENMVLFFGDDSWPLSVNTL